MSNNHRAAGDVLLHPGGWIGGQAVNVTKDGIEVKPGQVWRDLDKRMNGRTVVVLSVYEGRAKVQGARMTVLSIKRMYRHATGWEFVK